jgi:hypothetical protein
MDLLNNRMKKAIYINFICFFQTLLKEAILKPISRTDNYKEGWLIINQKVDYWFYYYENGNKKRRRPL